MKKLCLLFLLILFTVVFVACGGEAEVTNTPASTETAVPTNTAAPTAAPTDTVEPTSPPTDTPEPPATDTPEPTATAVPLPDFIEFNDNGFGISLQYPEAWFTSSEEDDGEVFFLFASDEAFLDGPDESEAGALLAVVILPPSSEPLTAVLEESIAEYDILRETNETVDPTTLLINERDAVQQRLFGNIGFDEEFEAVYTVVSSPTRNILLISLMPLESTKNYTAVIDRMTNSVQLFTPVTASTDQNDNFTFYTFQDSLVFRYPVNWVIEDNLENRGEIIMATSQEIIDGPQEDVTGAAVFLSLEPIEEYNYLPGDNLADALNIIFAEMIGPNSEVTNMQDPYETEINDRTAARTSFQISENGLTGNVIMTFIPSEPYGLVALAVNFSEEDNELDSTVEKVLSSITLPTDFATYSAESIPVILKHPTQWIVEEIDDGLVLQSDADLVADGAFTDGALQFVFWRQFAEVLSPVEYVKLFVREFDLITNLNAIQEPTPLTINAQNAAIATYSGEFEGTPVIVRYSAFVKGNDVVTSIALTPVELINEFQVVQDVVANSIRVLNVDVDFSDPASVVQGLIDTAVTQDFSLLADLCDPLGEHDGDFQEICSITNDHPLTEAFNEFFGTAKIIGEPEIDGMFAEVNIVFGPNGAETETIVLVNRDGLWYLYSF